MVENPLLLDQKNENNYFTEMCSGSEACSYLRLVDFVCHSTLGLKVIKRERERGTQIGGGATCARALLTGLKATPTPFRVPGFGLRVSGFELRVSCFVFRVSGFGFRVSGFGLRVAGLRFGVAGGGQGDADGPCQSAPTGIEGHSHSVSRAVITR